MHISTSSSNMFPSSTNPSAASGNHGMSSSQTPQKLKRVDTLDLKSKLSNALGSQGKRYWSCLFDFMTAKIDRTEFEEEAMLCLKPQHVHLHNSLILGLLYNASADVPGPSSRGGSGLHHHRNSNGQLVDADGNLLGRLLDDEDDDLQLLQPAKKRLRLLTAGLSRKERARIRNIPKQLAHARTVGASGAASLGWAGAGADMLEKKRKEEEKRRSVEEKQRVREAYTEIGAKDWRMTALRSQAQVTSTHDRLSLTTQQEIARALAIPLCVESKELPDVESMRDLMTLQSVEAGLINGAQAQAAALLLASLQCHLQNVMASVITKIRANRQIGIRTTGIQRMAAASSNAADEFQLVTDSDGVQSGDDSFETLTSNPSPTPNHLRVHRNLLHDTSSVSSSSISVGIRSAADSSMMSLASTAPTSVPAGSIASSEAASNNDNSASSNASAGAKSGSGEGEDENQSQDDILGGSRGKENHDPLKSNSLELRHLSFLLEIAPHSVVESLGQGSQERLLAADWTHADEDAERRFENTPEGAMQRQARMSSNAKLSSVSPASIAAAGQSAPPNGQASSRNAFIIDQLAPIRLFDRKTLAESQATNGVNALVSAGGKKGGLRLPSSKPTAMKGPAQPSDDQTNRDTNAHQEGGSDKAQSTNENKVPDLASMIACRYGGTNASLQGENATTNTQTNNAAAGSNHYRGQEPHLYDVVDPVALLASLVT